MACSAGWLNKPKCYFGWVVVRENTVLAEKTLFMWAVPAWVGWPTPASRPAEQALRAISVAAARVRPLDWSTFVQVNRAIILQCVHGMRSSKKVTTTTMLRWWYKYWQYMYRCALLHFVRLPIYVMCSACTHAYATVLTKHIYRERERPGQQVSRYKRFQALIRNTAFVFLYYDDI